MKTTIPTLPLCVQIQIPGFWMPIWTKSQLECVCTETEPKQKGLLDKVQAVVSRFPLAVIGAPAAARAERKR